MLKISEPPTQKEMKQSLKKGLIFCAAYLALLFLLAFRWGPVQGVLSYLVRPCQQDSSQANTNVVQFCPNWVHLIPSVW